MLEVITGYGNCLKYKDKLIQNFKKKSLNREYYRITNKEQNDKSQLIAQVYFNPSKRNVSNLKNCILWYEKRLSEGKYEYSFGLNSENNLKIPSKYNINFKENFSLKINYDNISESQLIFAKDLETFKTYLMIKLDLSNLSEFDLNHFINKYNLFKSDENIENNYFLNLGDVTEKNSIYNFFSFISEVRAVDNSTPYLKIVPIKTNINASNEIEKDFNEKLDEIFDEELFSEDILLEDSIKNLNDKLSQSLKSNKDLETKLNNLSNENKTLKNTNKDLELKLNKLSDENTTLKKSYEKIENKSNDLIKEKETLTNTKKDLETKLKQSSEENESLIKSRQDLEEKLADRNVSLKKANKELEKNLEELKKENKTLKKSNNDLKNKLNYSEKSFNDKTKEFEELLIQNNNLEKELKNISSKNEKLEKKHEKNTAEKRKLKKEIKDLNSEIEKSDDRINKYVNLYSELKENYDNQIIALQKKNNDLKLQLEEKNSSSDSNKQSKNSKSDHCKVCGKKFKKTDNFCTECGAKRIR